MEIPSTQKINITKIDQTKIHNVDFDNIDFGKTFTDHMFVCDYHDGQWEEPRIIPYQPMTIEPSARVFHYGQAVFEGMKAYKDEDDNIWLFRPQENIKRINISAKRLSMPEFPEEYFFNGLKTLLKLDKQWVKKGLGNSLYIRPFSIAIESAIAATRSVSYRFLIICSPVKAYYTSDVRVLVAEHYSRSADGGVGFAKAAGNYAAQFYPTQIAKDKGFQQIIWTDAKTHTFLEEAGTMNVFFRINNTLITAPTSDRILDGVTRKSIIQLAEDKQIDCEIRPVTIHEIKEAAKDGSLKELFGTGTAAIISPISAFQHQNELFELPKLSDSYAQMFKNQLLKIQHNLAEDNNQWRYKID